MRTLNLTLKNRIARAGTSLCRLLTLTRKDGTILRGTDCTFPVVYDGNTYDPKLKFIVSAISLAVGTGSTFELSLAESATYFPRAELMAGLFDEASVSLWGIDYLFPSYGHISLFEGTLSEIELRDISGELAVTVKGLIDTSRAIIPDVYQPMCRTEFGDDRCKVDLDPLKQDFTIVSVTDNGEFETDAIQADNYWAYGIVVWLTGDNVGQPREIRGSTGGTIQLLIPQAFSVQVGDTGTLYPGCDKLFDSSFGCTRWSNWINFRGEPLAPKEPETDAKI